jgi:HD-GYP domain-containing protein (c-di-GMP phosphodiesterase class II)
MQEMYGGEFELSGSVYKELAASYDDYDLLRLRRLSSEAVIAELDVCNQSLGILEHTARVVDIADKLSNCFSIGARAKSDLLGAARLHETGMIAVPIELITTAQWLPETLVNRIREQAKASAAIACATQTQRTVWLIEEQYTDYEVLLQQVADDSEDSLLAGILRVSDAYDAVKFPRPYQRGLTSQQRFFGLLLGQGTKYHPDVIDMLWEIGMVFPIE